MNATDLAPSPSLANATSNEDSAQDETIQTWTRLVRRSYPDLATPIARALAQRAAHGPYGLAMLSITQGLNSLDSATLRDMTGSELQMLSALLMHLREEVQRLLAQVNAQWRAE